MRREAAVKWRTLWRAFLGLSIAVYSVWSIAALASDPQVSLITWVALIGSALLLVWSYRDEDKARIAELERREKYAHELQDSLVSRVADLMDSARRTDPAYRDVEERRKRTEAILRDARKDAS